MPSNPFRSRGEVFELFQELFSRQVDERRGKVGPLSAKSLESLTKQLNSLASDLNKLDQIDRNAIMAEFRSELTCLIVHCRLEAAKRHFTPRPRR